MFEYRAKQAIGQSLNFNLPKTLAARHHAGFARAIKGGAAKLVGSSVQLTALRAGGSEFPIELSFARWGKEDEGGFAALIRDISKRKALARERQQAQALLDAVVANLPAMLFVKDAETREYLLVNKAGERTIGRPAKDIIGLRVMPGWQMIGDAWEGQSRTDPPRDYLHVRIDEPLCLIDALLFPDADAETAKMLVDRRPVSSWQNRTMNQPPATSPEG